MDQRVPQDELLTSRTFPCARFQGDRCQNTRPGQGCLCFGLVLTGRDPLRAGEEARQVAKYFSPCSLPSLPRQTAVPPEPQPAQNVTQEPGDAGTSLPQKYQLLGCSRTEQSAPGSVWFCVSPSLGKLLRADSRVILALKGGKVRCC